MYKLGWNTVIAIDPITQRNKRKRDYTISKLDTIIIQYSADSIILHGLQVPSCSTTLWPTSNFPFFGIEDSTIFIQKANSNFITFFG
ncbi:hypothetical protein D3C81_1684800 [compost metagenome]